MDIAVVKTKQADYQASIAAYYLIANSVCANQCVPVSCIIILFVCIIVINCDVCVIA